MERELVFDIDLTDYDDVRTCGKEGHICSLCWPLMAVAINVSLPPIPHCKVSFHQLCHPSIASLQAQYVDEQSAMLFLQYLGAAASN